VVQQTGAGQDHTDNAVWGRYFTKPDESWITPLGNPGLFTSNYQICQIAFRYRAFGHHKEIDPTTIRPADNPPSSRHTRETDGITFTPHLRDLAQKVVEGETNPYLRAKAIYAWICRNIIWTNPAIVFGNRAEHAARFPRGDCSAQAELFLTLCRLLGIPARVQGGWSIKPDRQHSQHSWAHVYFTPYGWLPVDPQAGSHYIDHPDETVRFFHFGNCLPYRLATFDDGSPFFPLQVHPQVGDGGPQIGSFEWRGDGIETYVKIDTRVSTVP